MQHRFFPREERVFLENLKHQISRISTTDIRAGHNPALKSCANLSWLLRIGLNECFRVQYTGIREGRHVEIERACYAV